MTPETGTALVILVAFVLPGFVTLVFNERTHVRRRDLSAFEWLLYALYYSVWVYGITALVCLAGSPWLPSTRREARTLWHGNGPSWQYVALTVGVLLVAPALISTVGRFWRESPNRAKTLKAVKIKVAHESGSAWDYLFDQEKAWLVRVRLTDATWIGGTYWNDSYSAYTRDGGDLNLQAIWTLDDEGWFVNVKEPPVGLWIPRESILYVEIYDDEPRPEAPLGSEQSTEPQGEDHPTIAGDHP